MGKTFWSRFWNKLSAYFTDMFTFSPNLSKKISLTSFFLNSLFFLLRYFWNRFLLLFYFISFPFWYVWVMFRELHSYLNRTSNIESDKINSTNLVNQGLSSKNIQIKQVIPKENKITEASICIHSICLIVNYFNKSAWQNAIFQINTSHCFSVNAWLHQINSLFTLQYS